MDDDGIDYENMFDMDTFIHAIEIQEASYEVDELPIDEYIELQPVDYLDYEEDSGC